MAKSRQGIYGTGDTFFAPPKKSRQGRSENTKLAANSRNKAKKKYRGQGK